MIEVFWVLAGTGVLLFGAGMGLAACLNAVRPRMPERPDVTRIRRVDGHR